MKKHRVLLVCSQHIFGAGMEGMLRAAEDVELIGPCGLGEDVCAKIAEASPGMILIVDEDSHSEAGARLSSVIMASYRKLPIVRAGLPANVVRVYSAHTLPARGADLLEIIRKLPVAVEAGKLSDERSESE